MREREAEEAGRRLRVVIVGAGFGGLACARALDGKPIDVLLVDRENFHLFTPLLYQVATALLNPSDIAFPLRRVFRRSRNVRVRQGDVVGIEFESKIVHLGDGAALPYDRLVLATGSANAYFGNPGFAGHTIGMKRLGDAMRLRNHVLSCLEMATRSPEPEQRRSWLTFVIAGGGPTGVEYAGALGELLRLVIGRDFPELTLDATRIVLVEGRDRLLGQFDARLGAYARRVLERRGVEVRVSTLVVSADERSVQLSDGELIACRTVVWSAGVRSSDPLSEDAADRAPGGRLVVDARLRVPGADGVFAIGDAAAAPERLGGEVLPMLSPPAMQEGRYVARLIAREARGHQRPGESPPFRYVDKGIMATIGRSSAVAQIGPFRFRGLVGWLAWLAVHIYYLLGVRNRAAVLASWAWNYIRKDRTIRIIARSEPDAVAESVARPSVEAPAREAAPRPDP